jgi:hypothetical protein
LRAIITAYADLLPDDYKCYRVAFIEAFHKRGMLPHNIRTASESELRWPRGDRLDEKARQAVGYIAEGLRTLPYQTQHIGSRRKLFEFWRDTQERVHETIQPKVLEDLLGNLEDLTGLILTPNSSVSGLTSNHGIPSFEVHSIRPARRRGPGGEEINHVVMGITQRRFVKVDGESLELSGGCTLILDLDSLELRYAISKPIGDKGRETRFRQWMGQNPTAAALAGLKEPIAYLHLAL